MLDRKLSYKPLDFGNGLVAGSVNDQGRIVALNTYHPQHGYVTLTNMPPFPNDRWYDPAFVRAYRAAQASPDLPGFGFRFGDNKPYLSTCSIDTGAMPSVRLEIEPTLTAEIVTFAPWPANGSPYNGVIQLCSLKSQYPQNSALTCNWRGLVALTRASYAQLTEGGPLPLPPASYISNETDGIFTIANRELGWAVAIMTGPVSEDGNLGRPWQGWQIQEVPEREQLEINLAGSLTLENNKVSDIAVVYGWGATAEQARQEVLRLAQSNLSGLYQQTKERWQVIDKIIQASGVEAELPGSARLIRQALVYILSCCAIPLNEGQATCLITDHQLLPLVWTRDAYYAIQALLALRKSALLSGEQAVAITIENVVRQHLIWLFEIAERPAGYWGRAYLANGKCKDFIFQLDQQCYPLLELVDYVEITGDKSFAQPLKPQLEEILGGLLARRAKEAWLFPTSETPADDKVEMPYHFSSQITLWHVFKRLAQLDVLERYRKDELLKIAGQIQQDIYHFMVAEHQQQKIFCYLTDLQDNCRFYHDANDWPTIFAPGWEFCPPDDPIWQNTLAFAFSSANQSGFYPGKYGGLGSVHTPHPWPLGEIQELYLARSQKDENRLKAVWAKLVKRACWDGNFPEASDENTNQVSSRHWFAWPGAMLVITLL
jgi:GH15 family glucan-1,4-alpha-glucosidase